MTEEQEYTLAFFRATKGTPEELLRFIEQDPARFQHKIKLVIGAYFTLAHKAEDNQGPLPGKPGQTIGDSSPPWPISKVVK